MTTHKKETKGGIKKTPCNTAAEGENGYFFLIGGSNNLLKLYNDHDSETTNKWITLLENRAKKLKRLNIEFLQIFIPEKTSILSHYYDKKLITPTPTYKSLKKIKSKKHINTLFFDDKIEGDEKASRYYRKKDTHLTTSGSRKLFFSTLSKLNLRSIIQNIEIKESESKYFNGDLALKFENINPNEKLKLFKEIIINGVLVPPPNLKSSFDPQSGNRGKLRVYTNKSAPIKKKVVAFSNSFYWANGSSLGQSWWFSRFFEEFHFIWSPSIDYSYIKHENPDIVICLSIERFLKSIPQD